ncbi:MAG: hypothetical protein LBF62_14270 [Tannerellaceae bacterium]|jgi:hypothetical protein|nr:hypothetical protein [Tannerellaceae bacterium]
MEKYLLIFISVFLLGSCTKESDLQQESIWNEDVSFLTDTTGVMVFNEWKDLEDFFKIERDTNLILSTEETIQTKAAVNDYVTTGYNYITVLKENYKCAFAGALAADMGVLPYQVWIVDYYNVYKTITIPTNGYFVAKDSPKCGYIPVGTGNGIKKGYASSTSGNKVTMFTLTICLKYDMSGKSYFRYCPTSHSNLTWNYSIINL